MAVFTKQKIAVTGLTPTFAAANVGGDSFVNDQADGSRTFLRVKNTGSSVNLIVDDPNSKDPGSATAFNPDLTVAIPATTGDILIGPIGPRFIDGNGSTNLAWSATPTGVTVAVLYF